MCEFVGSWSETLKFLFLYSIPNTLYYNHSMHSLSASVVSLWGRLCM